MFFALSEVVFEEVLSLGGTGPRGGVLLPVWLPQARARPAKSLTHVLYQRTPGDTRPRLRPPRVRSGTRLGSGSRPACGFPRRSAPASATLPLLRLPDAGPTRNAGKPLRVHVGADNAAFCCPPSTAVALIGLNRTALSDPLATPPTRRIEAHERRRPACGERRIATPSRAARVRASTPTTRSTWSLSILLRLQAQRLALQARRHQPDPLPLGTPLAIPQHHP